jgi:DNA mismatch repair protein MutS2
MISITEKTLQDLQFPTVLKPYQPSVIQTLEGKSFRNNSFQDKDTLMRALLQSEYVSSFKIIMPFPITVLMPLHER